MPNIHEVEEIVFPSQIKVDPSEVEKPLRRQFRTRKDIPTWVLLLLAVIIATIAYFEVGKVVDDQAHAEAVSQKITASLLCEQYKKDAELAGRPVATTTLNQVCL